MLAQRPLAKVFRWNPPFVRTSAVCKKLGKSDWSRKGSPVVFEVTIFDVETQNSCPQGSREERAANSD
jgi:hypothetical protein